jgi:hypothetical protein
MKRQDIKIGKAYATKRNMVEELVLVLDGLDAYEYWEVADANQRNDAAVIWSKDDENAAMLDDIEKLYDRLYKALTLARKEYTP